MFKLLLLTLVLVPLSYSKTVSLAWNDTTNPVGTTYTIYRANSACSTATLFTKYVLGVTLKNHDDLNVLPGTYCYKVTANFNGIESAFSNTAEAIVPLAAPENLRIVADTVPFAPTNP